MNLLGCELIQPRDNSEQGIRRQPRPAFKGSAVIVHIIEPKVFGDLLVIEVFDLKQIKGGIFSCQVDLLLEGGVVLFQFSFH